MQMTIEDDVAVFLGVLVKKNGNQIELLQEGLRDKIINALGLSGGTVVSTPAEGKCIEKDVGGEPANEHFNYRSVV
eukprot:1037663-Ditylum_brightwellii.AAC.1